MAMSSPYSGKALGVLFGIDRPAVMREAAAIGNPRRPFLAFLVGSQNIGKLIRLGFNVIERLLLLVHINQTPIIRFAMTRY